MYNIGVDLGGTNIVVGLVNIDGKIISKMSTKTLSHRENDEILEDIAILIEKIILENNIKNEEIDSIGIGSPGTCDSTNGVIVHAFNLGFENVHVSDFFKKRFNFKVYLENDANCAAFGEFIFGSGKKYKSSVVITLGTGLGCGLILDGKIISGAYHGGGEFGHMVISVDGRPCTCGRLGCWEAYCSANAIILEAKKRALENPSSKLYKMVDGDVSKIDAKMPFDAASDGDKIGLLVVNDYLRYLAEGLANLINAVEPEIIVIGGGVSAQKDALIVPLKKLVNERCFGGSTKTLIEIASLGNDAGLVGAAFLSRNM